MNDPARMPPRHVTDAANVVDQWLKSVEPTTPKSAEEIARMSFAEQIDYCRRFPQSSLPPWRDPRA
jgi:uncharacterized protein YeaO (DUF488 family)